MKQIIAFITIALSTALQAATTTVYNSTELATAISSLSPGDTVILADGNYASGGLAIDTIIGTETSPVTIQAQNVGGAHWQGYFRLYDSSYITLDGIFFDLPANRSYSQAVHIKNNDHCSFTRCTFDLDETGMVTTNIRYWVMIEDGSYNEFAYCQFNDKITKNPTIKVIYDEYKPHIHHNYFNTRTYAGGLNGYETLQLGSGATGHKFENMQAKVEYNLFEECDGEAEIISSKTSGNQFRFNTFMECRGQLVLRMADNCMVFNNYFLNPSLKVGVGGVRIHGSYNDVYNNYFERLTGEAIETRFGDTDTTLGTEEVGYRQAKENLIAFNTMFNCRREVINFNEASVDYPLPPTDWAIMNNLFVIYDTPLICGTGDTNTLYENNIADEIGNSGITEMGRTLNSNEMWVTYHYLEEQSDEIWRQRDIAPGRDQATPLTFLYYQKDLDHEPRDSTPDIGADEYRSYAPSYHPLTSSDVGPSAY